MMPSTIAVVARGSLGWIHFPSLRLVAKVPVHARGPSVKTRTLSHHQWQNDPDDDQARNSVRDEPHPGALIHTPRLVQVVETEHGPVGA
jgi:hypothetical protein